MSGPSQEARERHERFTKFLRELVGLPRMEETMRTIPVEAAPVCVFCEEEPADPMFGNCCSAACSTMNEKRSRLPSHECGYCGTPLHEGEGRFCSRGCRAADESDHG